MKTRPYAHRKWAWGLFLGVVVLATGYAQAQEGAVPAVIPRPTSMRMGEGSFTITENTVIEADEKNLETARYLADALAPATGFRLEIVTKPDGADNVIAFATVADDELGTEGYRLNVSGNLVAIYATTPAGAFYACQTLHQLLPPAIESPNPVPGATWTIPCVSIMDRPDLAWRGFMLDSARNYQTKEFIKGFIDKLALYKINHFHWHYNDDEAWRIPASKYPELVKPGDKGYTHDDVREIVAHAAARHMIVYPEIEMPGHSTHALRRYPELSCEGVDPAKQKVKEYCLGKDETFRFLQDVIEEAMELFPGPYIHIGGDEATQDHWKQCADCRARMKNERLYNNTTLLQMWFMKKMNAFVIEKGRTSIAWAENYTADVPKGQIVHAWHSGESRFVARKGFRTINSEHESVYFNYPMSPGDRPRSRWMPVLSLRTVYRFDPVPSGLTPEQQKLVLGSEACLWTNLFEQEKVYYKTFPRLFAFSEIVWTSKKLRNWDDFQSRVDKHLARLDAMGVDYYSEKKAAKQE